MAFPRYSELPAELRLRIIEEALDSVCSNDNSFRAKVERQLSTYACVDREWNRVVELRLFKDIALEPRDWRGYRNQPIHTIQDEVDEFGTICGKRSGRLSRISLSLYIDDFIHHSWYNAIHLQTLWQLFNLMKDWTHRNREQQGLIEVKLNFDYMVDSLPPMPVHDFDMGRFPQVPVIGSIHEPEPKFHVGRLHPWSLASLCQNLPHVHHTSLTLPPEPCEYVSRQNIIDSLDSLRIHNPGLTHLDLKAACTDRWVPKELEPTLLPIAECLTASSSPWCERLVSLKIHHNIVVQDFLRAAGKVSWPNLNSVELLGVLDVRTDGDFVDKDHAKPVANETGSSVIGELIAAFPSMPKTTKFQIRMVFNTAYPTKAFEVSIDLGNIGRTEEARNAPACGDKFVPSTNNGTAKLDGLCPSGSLATQLQDTVRDRRRQDLEVFSCTEDWHYYYRQPHSPCVQWNRQADCWDSVFANDMDIFIYRMGQFWEWTHGYGWWL